MMSAVVARNTTCSRVRNIKSQTVSRTILKYKRIEGNSFLNTMDWFSANEWLTSRLIIGSAVWDKLILAGRNPNHDV